MASETGRIEAFSDGVFAIAITLLILEIKVPTAGAGALAPALLRQWPQYVAFLISFAFIGIMWINHHRLFTSIRRADDALLYWNLLLMFFVCVIPFPTEVLAAFLRTADRRAAMLLFNLTYLGMAVSFSSLRRHAVRANLHNEHAPESHSLAVQYSVGPLAYLGCLIIGWFNVYASLVISFALALWFALPPRVATRAAKDPARA